jgi:hypothetical protein
VLLQFIDFVHTMPSTPPTERSLCAHKQTQTVPLHDNRSRQPLQVRSAFARVPHSHQGWRHAGNTPAYNLPKPFALRQQPSGSTNILTAR